MLQEKSHPGVIVYLIIKRAGLDGLMEELHLVVRHSALRPLVG